MKKLEMRLDLFGEGEGVSAGGGEAATPAQQTATPAPEGVTAQPQREGRRPNIFPMVPKVDAQRARPERSTARQIPAATAAEQPPQPQAQQAPAETWEDVKKRYKTEYGADVKAAVDARFRNQADLSGRLNSAMQIVSFIAPFYGFNADEQGNYDMDKLNKALQDDNRFYEQEALNKGIPVETEKHIRQLEMQEARRKQEARISLEDQRYRQRYDDLREQEKVLKQEFPDFDMMTEIQRNPDFSRMCHPDSGLNLRQAFLACYGDAVIRRQAQATEERTKQNMSRAIQAGAMRPQENGMTGTGGGIQSLDPLHMTREQRMEIRRRVQAGEKIAFSR